MTLTLELTEEEEARLNAGTKAAGMNDPAEYVRSLISGKATDAPPHRDMMAHLRAIGVIGAVQSTPRADGQAWSEIEAACDPS